MNVKIIFAICVVALLCLTTSTEGGKLRKAFRRIGKATEKVGKKALQDGLVTAYLGSKIGKRSVDGLLEESRIPETDVWHNEATIYSNGPAAGENLDKKNLFSPY